MITFEACSASVNASCIAESPPPTTATTRSRNNGASQLAQWLAAVGFHGFDEFAHLIRDAFERGAHDVSFGRAER